MDAFVKAVALDTVTNDQLSRIYFVSGQVPRLKRFDQTNGASPNCKTGASVAKGIFFHVSICLPITRNLKVIFTHQLSSSAAYLQANIESILMSSSHLPIAPQHSATSKSFPLSDS